MAKITDPWLKYILSKVSVAKLDVNDPLDQHFIFEFLLSVMSSSILSCRVELETLST